MYKFKRDALKKVVSSVCILVGAVGLSSKVNAYAALRSGVPIMYSNSDEMSVQNKRLSSSYNSLAKGENKIATLWLDEVNYNDSAHQFCIVNFFNYGSLRA